MDAHFRIVVIPQGRAYNSPARNGITGLTWKTVFGFVDCNAFGLETSDGGGSAKRDLPSVCAGTKTTCNGRVSRKAKKAGHEFIAIAHAGPASTAPRGQPVFEKAGPPSQPLPTV
ncbi:MAG TPA: hypothetical protein DCZ95_15830 [Verrucomicrobia bacterium]|nr:MAG: hypothetical protein A2X46_12790 [Lentisphaerae bacterium GWF2_57_35]HBA85554.1 hypothetical protein [Verrucomicrobiota bacterium]